MTQLFGRRAFRLFTSASVILVALTSFNCVAQELGDTGALLKAVIAQNTAALKRIDSLYVAFSWREEAVYTPFRHPGGTSPGGPVVAEGHTKLWHRGELYHQDLDLRRVWTDSQRVSDVSCIVVSSRDFLIDYNKTSRQLRLYRFDNPQSLYEPVKSLRASFPQPDILELGFKIESITLGETYERLAKYQPPAFRWKIDQVGEPGAERFAIKTIYIRDGKAQLRKEFVVDPQRDYLITSFRAYDKEGKLGWSMSTELQELPSGHWFPKSGTLFSADREQTSTFLVEDVRVNEPISDSQFQLDSMNFETARALMREFTNSGRTMTERGYWEGQWVPISMLPPERLSDIRDAQEEVDENLNVANPTKETKE